MSAYSSRPKVLAIAIDTGAHFMIVLWPVAPLLPPASQDSRGSEHTSVSQNILTDYLISRCSTNPQLCPTTVTKVKFLVRFIFFLRGQIAVLIKIYCHVEKLISLRWWDGHIIQRMDECQPKPMTFAYKALYSFRRLPGVWKLSDKPVS